LKIKIINQENPENHFNLGIKLIHELNKAGIITIQRMCFTCSHYQNNTGQHYCKLLQSTLATTDLRVDCPEHELLQ
jgi:hypothetical protein